MSASSDDWRAVDPLAFISSPGLLYFAAGLLLHTRGRPVTITVDDAGTPTGWTVDDID